MLLRVIFILFLVLSLFLEATILPFPLVVLFSIFYFIFFEETVTFLVIFLVSVCLDTLLLSGTGYTAFFLFLFFILLITLEKVFTLRFSALVIALSALIGVEAYRKFASYPLLLGPEILFGIGLILFIIIERRVSGKGEHT